MAIYVVGYDIPNAGDDTYTELDEYIKKQYPNSIHPLDSTWFIETDQDDDKVFWTIAKMLKEPSRLIVAALNGVGSFTNNFKKSDATWLRKRLVSCCLQLAAALTTSARPTRCECSAAGSRGPPADDEFCSGECRAEWWRKWQIRESEG
jgi:hypothetical protein